MAARPDLIDRRELEFSEAGLLRAINASLSSAEMLGLRLMPAHGVRIEPDAGKLSVLYGSGRLAEALSLNAEQLGALLILYCVRRGIPVPRGAAKAVRIEKEAVVLTLTCCPQIGGTGGHRPATRHPVAAKQA